MKNIQVIDGATNCAYSIFQATDKSFKIIFPVDGQDIEFIEDFVKRVGKKRTGEILAPLWKHRLAKKDAAGIHGTLFYELGSKKVYYPNKQEADLDDPLIQSQANHGSRRRRVTK